MTLASDLITRVRSVINESSSVTSPERTDAEILQWIQDGQLDYVDRIPGEFFPELIEESTFSGASLSLTSDYFAFHACTVSYTMSGTYTGTTECFMERPGDTYMINNFPGYMGAYCYVKGDTIYAGPNVFSGTLSYIKKPTSLSTFSTTLELHSEHENALVAYAAMKALQKTNDPLSSDLRQEYFEKILGKGGKAEAKEVKRA